MHILAGVYNLILHTPTFGVHTDRCLTTPTASITDDVVTTESPEGAVCVLVMTTYAANIYDINDINSKCSFPVSSTTRLGVKFPSWNPCHCILYVFTLEARQAAWVGIIC